MADSKQKQEQVDAPVAGVEAKREPKDIKDRLTFQQDRELHPSGEPKREADKTSYPVPNDAQPEDPPVRTTRPDVPILRAVATGAGQHVPPDPEKYQPDSRPKD